MILMLGLIAGWKARWNRYAVTQPKEDSYIQYFSLWLATIFQPNELHVILELCHSQGRWWRTRLANNLDFVLNLRGVAMKRVHQTVFGRDVEWGYSKRWRCCELSTRWCEFVLPFWYIHGWTRKEMSSIEAWFWVLIHAMTWLISSVTLPRAFSSLSHPTEVQEFQTPEVSFFSNEVDD